jgi:hypothetical protein
VYNGSAFVLGRLKWEACVSKNFDNRRRAFADVVTIDAWHDAFDGEKARADLHADIVFGTARVGGEPESPIRFRLSIKRAEIVLVVPPSEPITIDRSSVSRDSPDLPGRQAQRPPFQLQESWKLEELSSSWW